MPTCRLELKNTPQQSTLFLYYRTPSDVGFGHANVCNSRFICPSIVHLQYIKSWSYRYIATTASRHWFQPSTMTRYIVVVAPVVVNYYALFEWFHFRERHRKLFGLDFSQLQLDPFVPTEHNKHLLYLLYEESCLVLSTGMQLLWFVVLVLLFCKSTMM